MIGAVPEGTITRPLDPVIFLIKLFKSLVENRKLFEQGIQVSYDEQSFDRIDY